MECGICAFPDESLGAMTLMLPIVAISSRPSAGAQPRAGARGSDQWRGIGHGDLARIRIGRPGIVAIRGIARRGSSVSIFCVALSWCRGGNGGVDDR